MKKRLFAVIVSALLFCFTGCEKPNELIPETPEPDKPIADEPILEEPDSVASVTLSNRNGSVSNTLTEKDSVVISELFLNDEGYKATAPNCLMDCYLSIGEFEFQYHSDCGNIMRLDSGMCKTLTEDEKNDVNDIFSKYMTLGFAPNVKPDPEENEPSSEVSDPSSWKIDVTLENITPTGLTFGCLLIDSFDVEVLTGSPYEIRRLWLGEETPLETLNDSVWTMEAWIVNGGSEYKWNIDWTNVYGELKDGVYYISKNFSSNSPYGSDRKSEYGAYFVIDTSGEFYKNDPWGVSMMICPGAENEWVLVYGNDRSKGSFSVSSEYWLEVYDSAGWFKMDGFEDGWVRNETEIDGICYESVDWTSRCGSLPGGMYRIGKNVTYNGETKAYYAEFEIAEVAPIYVTHYMWDVSLSVSHVTPTGLIYTLDIGDSTGPSSLTVDGSYGIERLEGYQWVSYKLDGSNAGKTSTLGKNSSVSNTVDWESSYGRLSEGKYRFVKKFRGTVSSNDVENSVGDRVYYAEFEIGSPEDPVIDDPWGISFDVVKATSDSLTIGYMQYGGEHPDWEYVVETPYWIERFNGEVWETVPYRTNDIGWPEMAGTVINNKTSTMHVNLVSYIGNLPVGKYRIGKNVCVYGAVESKYKDGVHLSKPYYAEFEIEKDWGVTVKAEDVSVLGLTLVCNVGDIPEDHTVKYYESYTLEKLVGDGWQKVNGINFYDFNLENVWEASENSTFSLTIPWSMKGVILSPGYYRVGKNFVYSENDMTRQSRNVYAEFEIEDPNAYSSDLWGISLRVDDVTPDGLTLYCTQSGDTPGEVISYEGRDIADITVGMAFWLEQYVSGEWIKLQYLTENTVSTWTTMVWKLYVGSTAYWPLEWKNLYGSLLDGRYRVCKEFVVKPKDGNYYNFNAYAEFYISESRKSASDYGISATAENVTPKGLDYVLKQSNSDGYYRLASKSEYSFVLERKEGDFWEEVKPLKESYILEYATYWIPAEENVVISIDWSEFYGDLKAGTYRISKHIYCDAYGNDVDFDVYAEFNIK